MKLSAILAQVSAADLLAIASVSCVLRGLLLLNPAAFWIGAGVACGFVSIELGKREASRRKQE